MLVIDGGSKLVWRNTKEGYIMSKAKNEKCSEKWFTDPNDLILRIALWEEYGYKDVYYGEFIPFRNLQVDHIIPMSRGGKSIPENLQILCRKCNGVKGGKSEGEY